MTSQARPDAWANCKIVQTALRPLDGHRTTGQRLEQRQVLMVDVGDLGVAVVDDVERLLRRHPVVERHRDRADLPGRVHHRHHVGRVRPAPEDVRARQRAQRQQQVRHPVRLRLELGVGPRHHGAARPVVDDGGLVRLAGGVDRKDVVRHRTVPRR